MAVERVAGSSWNQWPDVHGMGGRMPVESAIQPPLIKNSGWHLHGLIMLAIQSSMDSSYCWGEGRSGRFVDFSIRNITAEPHGDRNLVHSETIAT